MLSLIDDTLVDGVPTLDLDARMRVHPCTQLPKTLTAEIERQKIKAKSSAAS